MPLDRMVEIEVYLTDDCRRDVTSEKKHIKLREISGRHPTRFWQAYVKDHDADAEPDLVNRRLGTPYDMILVS